MSIAIRPEVEDDAASISALVTAAFREAPHSSGTEARIVEQLRRDGDLVLSLVATNYDRAIIGHIAFSPVTISSGVEGWYGLGPVSVIPSAQRDGIGKALIERGIADMRARGARGIVLLGDPEYYARFGFRADPELIYPGPPAENFQMQVLEGEKPEGTVSYASAFG